MTGVLTDGSSWWRIWCGLRMTDWKKDWSADWNRSDTDGVCVGRNPYLTALFIIASRLLHSDALRNPAQAELTHCNCKTRVARATSHMASPKWPWSLIVFNVYIDLAAFSTSWYMPAKTQYLVQLYTKNDHTFNPRNVWDTWRTSCELAVFGVYNHYEWLVCVEFKTVLHGPLGNMQVFMLNRLGIDRWNY